MNVIGIAGPKGSGKTEVANILTERIPGSIILNLPDPIYAACQTIFGWSYEQCVDPVLREEIDERFGISPRYAQETLGTDWGRNLIHNDLWTILLEDRISQHPESLVIIPNIRFPNEADLVRKFRGAVWEVRRPGYDYNPAKPSEAGIPRRYIDASILNTDNSLGWRETLEDQVLHLYEYFFEQEEQ